MQPTVFRVSASQLNRFELCPSLWAYDYLARVGKDDAKPLPLIEGSYVASLLESYARALVKADDLPDEIYASKHRDFTSVACIEDKCYVMTFNEYCRSVYVNIEHLKYEIVP